MEDDAAFVKVSDRVVDVDKLKVGIYVTMNTGDSVTVPSRYIQTIPNEYGSTLIAMASEFMLVVYSDNALIPGSDIAFQEAGTYFISSPELFVARIEIESIKQLDKKFIPSELPEVTNKDSGKFLRVSVDGKWEAEAIANAEEASF